MKISEHAITRTRNRVGKVKPLELWKSSRIASGYDLARFCVESVPGSEYRISKWHGVFYLLIRDTVKDILVAVIRKDVP